MLVSYDEARQFLAARTMISSNLGSVLEHMKAGMPCSDKRGTSGGSASGAWEQSCQESRLLYNANVIRCLDALAAKDSISWRAISIPDLHRFARRYRIGDGQVAVRVLYAYEPWSSQWPEKGLVEAYQWLQSVRSERRARYGKPDTLLHPAPGEELAQSFRAGKYKSCRKMAAAIVADAHVALAHWTTHVWGHYPRRAA